ncbi:hypothetical protein BA190_14970 [Labrys sp. WJW]|uniref:hypothetical protein n=1 Tax=Labrys sp. WJW TaxID=1737983 RepID=UPI00082D9DA1|nr:hypothetical protein [Labrys sp. WJW]OCC04179.1 hypothetical protein BA190_14970 [Labrys sp. WJW]
MESEVKILDFMNKIRYGEIFSDQEFVDFSEDLISLLKSSLNGRLIDREVASLLVDIALVFSSSEGSFQNNIDFYRVAYERWILLSDEIREILLP